MLKAGNTFAVKANILPFMKLKFFIQKNILIQLQLFSGFSGAGGGLNEMAPIGLRHLKTWSSAGSPVWGDIEGMALLWIGFEGSKALWN